MRAAAATEVWMEAIAERQRDGDLETAARISRLVAVAARDGGDVESGPVDSSMQASRFSPASHLGGAWSACTTPAF